MDENRIEGTAQEAIGKVEDAAGGLTGDAELQADGKFDQVIGTLKRNYGAASDRVGDAARVAGREAGAMAGKAYDVGVDTEQRLAEAVSARPLSWLFGSIALGYAIGMLIHSSVSPLAPRPRASRYFGR